MDHGQLCGRRTCGQPRHMREMYHVLVGTVPYLPVNKPTYLMGVRRQPIFWRGVGAALTSLTVFIPSQRPPRSCIHRSGQRDRPVQLKYEKDMRPIGEAAGADLPPLQQSLSAICSRQKSGNWHALMCSAQSVLLQHGNDGRNQGCAGCRKFASTKEEKLYGMEQISRGEKEMAKK